MTALFSFNLSQTSTSRLTLTTVTLLVMKMARLVLVQGKSWLMEVRLSGLKNISCWLVLFSDTRLMLVIIVH